MRDDVAAPDTLARPPLSLDEHGRPPRRDARHELVDLEHRGALADQGVGPDGMMLDRGQGDRHFSGGGADAAQRLQQIVPTQREGEERSEEHTSELQSPDHLVCRLLLEKKKKKKKKNIQQIKKKI